MRKTKPIEKPLKEHNAHSRSKPSKKPVVDEHGDPLIKNLSDFVTSIKILHSSKPIYTGGRILAVNKHIYATCNGEIVVYSIETGEVVNRIKYVSHVVIAARGIDSKFRSELRVETHRHFHAELDGA